MVSINDLLRSGKVQLSDRRKEPRFRFRGPIEIIAVDVVGSIVPTEISGWTTDISTGGAVLTVTQKLTSKGVFIRFAASDELVMPASISRTIAEESGFYTYAAEFASIFDTEQLLRILKFAGSSEDQTCSDVARETIGTQTADR